jgi:hypothetical protein
MVTLIIIVDEGLLGSLHKLFVVVTIQRRINKASNEQSANI